MKILVTGGLGTIGVPLCKELKERGHQVLALDRYHSFFQKSFSHTLIDSIPSYVRCDIADYRQLERVFKELGPFDFVYHCAAEYGRWNGEDYYEQLWSSNAIGVKNLLLIQRDFRFKLIHFSTSEVYGDYEGVMDEAVTEQKAIRQLNDYALSKWCNECQIKNSEQQFGTESVILRLFNIYGAGEPLNVYRSFISRFIYSALKREPLEVFEGHSRTALYIDDAIRTFANVVECFNAREVYNIASTESFNIEEIAKLIIRLSGNQSKLIKLHTSEMMTVKSKSVSIEKAKRDLGHQPQVSLEAGIEKTLDWARKILGEETLK